MTHAAPSRTDHHVTGPGERQPQGEAAAIAGGWACENCSENNSLRRRRCRDCGTSRH
jgi:hypothetical protein